MTKDLRDLMIAYSLLPFLTPNRTRLLRESFDPLTDARRASHHALQDLMTIDRTQAALVKNPLTPENRSRIEALRESVITLGDDDYPLLLRHIPDPPLVLHVLGRRELLGMPALAVVGSRKASPYAVNVTRHLVAPLASQAGLVVVSGLAEGVDATAHAAALDAGGTTIAVLGTGIDRIYPRQHRQLFSRIVRDGVAISELAPGTPPLKMNFPMRNRLISGLAAGTVIVEASGKSGSLITARTALEQGRDVFAVPGSIFSPGSEGTHRLIQSGAKLVHDANDILEELKSPVRIATEQGAGQPPPEPLREVLEALTREEGTSIDAMATRSRRSITALCDALLQLELGGWVRALPGARYVRMR
jgi:DNA processing protein